MLSYRCVPVWTPLHVLKQPQQNGRLLWLYGPRSTLLSINRALRPCVLMTFRASINSAASEEALRQIKQLSMESYRISQRRNSDW
jgi:hypothetical protein